MRRRHFDQLAPRCPTCWQPERSAELSLAAVYEEHGDDVEHGLLLCSSEACQREYPIIDGIPILVRDIRRYFSQHLQAVIGRRDLPAPLETLIGDCAGAGSLYDAERQMLSSYGWSHYCDLGDAGESPFVRVFEQLYEFSPEPAEVTLDLGCATGRGSFEAARRSSGLVLGVDLSFAMLRLARRVLKSGVVDFARRRVGLVYDRWRAEFACEQAERVDFWVCDAERLPFRGGLFDQLLSLNVLDCTASPLDHLASLARVLAPGALLRLTTPYDWSPQVTPMEAWLGGHSQRSPEQGAPEDALRRALSGAFEVIAERSAIEWRVRVHDRHEALYQLHALIARRREEA